MSGQMSWSWRILGGGAAALVLLGGGIGVGVALTGGAAAATAAPLRCSPARQGTRARLTATRAAAARCRRVPAAQRLLGHTLHAQLTVKTKTGYSTVAFERGTIGSVGGGTLTVRAADGTTWTWHLLKGSVLREKGSKLAASQLAAGDRVLIVGPVSGGANYVKMAQIRPGQLAEPGPA